jgi:hypothetical protein
LDRVTESLKQASQASAELLAEGRDNEVIGNDYRVRADVLWKQGQQEPALQNYALAVFYAYLFQCLPKPPDFYTLDFYVEMVTRSCNRVWELWSGGQKAVATQACLYLRQFWQPYWELVEGSSEEVDFQAQLESGDLEVLEKLIFPRRPIKKDMDGEDTEYVDQVLQVAKALQDKVKEIG